MKTIISLCLAILLAVPAAAVPVAVNSKAAYGPSLSAAHVMGLHHAAFSQKGSLLPLIKDWNDALPGLELEQRAALELVLKAASAPSIDEAGVTAFSAPLGRVPQQMTAELALLVRAESNKNPALRAELELIRSREWGAVPAGPSALAGSPAMRQLAAVMNSWKPGVDGVERIRGMSPAVISWREATVSAFGLKSSLPVADWLKENQIPQAELPGGQNGSAQAGQRRGFGGGFKGKGNGNAVSATASQRVPMSEAMVGVFDADDNLWINVNKVWVFKKGASRALENQRAIPSEKFADVRGEVGKSGEYADYEYWDDPEKGSFREFRDPGNGSNPLLDNLKEALRTRPLADIFGHSWDAFVYMLSVNPKSVYILTAGGLSPEKYVEALEYLKEQKLIPAVPPVGNIDAVGHPKHRYYAATSNPSQAKGQVLAEHADRQQKRAEELGPDRMPLMLNADGNKLVPIMPLGFSDDDHGNYEKGKAVFTEGIKQGKWQDVKVSLFYTDRDDPNSGSFVIKRDGSLREITADEFNETYVEATSQEDGSKRGKGKRNPYPEVVRSPLKSFDDAVENIYFTVDSPIQDAGPKVKTEVEQIAMEAQAIKNFVDQKVPKGAKKQLIVERYTMGEAVIADALEYAVDGDVPTTVVTDFNTSMDADFGGQPMLADFAKARPNARDGGTLLKRLLAKGYKIHDKKAKHLIVSQPLYDHADDNMDPIMHRKKLIMVVELPNGKKEYRYFASSGNWSNKGQRVNMVLETRAPEIVEHAIKNSKRIVETFLAGKPIDQIKPVRPRKVVFENGESVLLSYTDGQYNTNENYVEVIERTVEDPENYQLVDADLYHFVPTMARGLDAIKAAMEKHPESRLYAVFDMKFSSQRGWGKSPALGGYLTLHPFGKPTFPWSRAVRDRVEGYVYMRGIEGVPQLDLEGPPTGSFVYHLKISQARVREKGEVWSYSSVGSFNFSNNLKNAEFQWLMRLRPESKFHGIVRELALGHARAHKDEYAIPLWRAPLRDTAARLIGHSPLELPMKELSSIEASLRDGELTALGFKLHELLAMGTSLVRDTVTPDVARRLVERFLGILGLYQELGQGPLGGTLTKLNSQRASTAALALAYRDNGPYEIKSALRSLFWERALSYEQLDALVGNAFNALGLSTHVEQMQRLRAPAEGRGEG